VDVIAEDLQDLQIILTTHDERFYKMLKYRLVDKGWQFDRITNWVLAEGPKRESDASVPHEVNMIIENKDPRAGDVLRQYMEEWLDKMCADYQTYTLHKREPKEFERTLFDFWGPFIEKLKKMEDNFFLNRIEKKLCYERLRTHPLINYYSHWQANPYEWGDIGDVKYVWEEFQEFQKCFSCFSCSKTLKYDRDANRLYCTCGKQIYQAESVTSK
jgi:hypothetical protein